MARRRNAGLRIRQKRLQYLVKWLGYDEPGWQPAEAVNETATGDVFDQRYRDQPGPLLESSA